jgi:impB/mucB/samB family protein
MRIACLHLPQFALQCVTRIDTSLRGAPVVVVGAALDGERASSARGVGAALHGPVVLACSRAAWTLGARVGMTAVAARHLSPELRVVSADPQLERETVRAIADALLHLSAVVDTGGRVGQSGTHLAMYCEVPSKTRGTSFAEKLIAHLDRLGLTARIGIADDRFTAWVAAAFGPPLPASGPSSGPASGARASAHEPGLPHLDEPCITSVPRGGSAAFLAPRPLSLLAITPEVQHMLESLGVGTLGEFAALPAPSVARPLEADYQALARGESGHTLRPYTPEAPVREELALAAGTSVAAAIAVLAERIALRLGGRGRGAARIEVVACRAAGESSSLVDLVARGGVIRTPEAIAEALGQALTADRGSATPRDGHTGEAGANAATVWRLRVVVAGEALAPAAYDQAIVEAAPAAPPAAELDTLVLVLSNSGSWNLTSPALRAERRESHHRIQRSDPPTMSWRRGKRHRDTEARASLIQPRLFKNLP